MMARASASLLAMRGGSASRGRFGTARPTRSRTSLAAASMSRSMSNSMETAEDSSRLVEVMTSIPSIPATASSTICVTWDSTIFAEAPL